MQPRDRSVGLSVRPQTYDVTGVLPRSNGRRLNLRGQYRYSSSCPCFSWFANVGTGHWSDSRYSDSHYSDNHYSDSRYSDSHYSDNLFYG
jgi:hypothetical protein